MLVRYKGGRVHYKISPNRKPYYFTPENNHIADIQEQEVINYIFSLPNRAEFEAVMEETKPLPIAPEIKEEPKAEVKEKIIKKIVKSKKKKGGR